MLTGSSNRMRNSPDDDRYTFEVSWEVCNKVGGINTVIRSKAAVTVAELGDNYFLLGPYVEEKMRTEVEIVEPDDYYIRAAVEAMRDRGVRVVTGRWLIAGNPWVILFDLGSSWKRRDEWMKDFWNVSHISIPDSDKETVNAVVFGELVTWFLGEFSSRNSSKRTVAHFHEWQAGVGCILTRTRGLEIGTIFTTHATLLGRYLCAGSSDFYNNMPYFDCEGEARRRGIHHRYCMEMAACHAAHIFTTVSRITQDESEHLLKRRPDLITPNGLNVHKFSAIHEFQNLHAIAKEKINNFVQGHFYGHVDFDLDKTIYLFSAGRNEYFNKGVDLFLEGLAKLNYFLKRDNCDVTVVAFLIFPEETNNYNIDSLNGQAQHKKLKESVEKIQKSIGDRIFQTVLRGQLPTEKLLTRDDEVLLKNYLYHSKPSSLPPIVTHNLVNERGSEIMNHIKKVRLFNHHADKVKVIYHPEFLSTTSPLLNIDYPEFVRGCHLGVFPSYYEPWGYTPAECTVMGIPSITTNLSGFGCFMAEHIADPTAYGIYIVDRRFKSPEESVDQLANQMLCFAKQTRRQRIIQRNRTERLSDLMDWNSLGNYYVRARHMALKALDVTYNIPTVTLGDISGALDNGPDYKSHSPNSFRFPRPASQPPSPTHSRRSSVNMDSDEENEDRQMIKNITKTFGVDDVNGQNRSLGDIMDIKQDVLSEAMTKVKTKENKKGLLRQLSGLSEIRPAHAEDVSLNAVNVRNSLIQDVNKELIDKTVTKEKKKSLLKEVEARGEQKENKTVLLAELGKLGKLKDSVIGDENVNLANVHVEKKKKDAAMSEIALIGRSKEMKETVQRELTTISHMRDAKAGAMQEIRDRIDTKDKKKVVMDDISKMKVVKDARMGVLNDIHKIGSINATVFSSGKVCEPLPKVYSGQLSVISEINERGQRKEAKMEALKELVIKHDTKSNKAAAMSELKGISASKSAKEAAMQEIKDRETTKDVKGAAMAELKKVADIKEKVGAPDLPIGAAEKAIAVKSKAMKDINTIGIQKDTKSQALKEMLTISSTKDTKERVVGEISQIGQARNAKEAAHLELRTLTNSKENKENMQNELMNKTDGVRQNVLSDIEARGKQADDEREALSQFVAGHSQSVKIAGARINILSDIEARGAEADQGKQNVAALFEGRAKQMNVLSDIKDMGKEKEEGIKNVEALFAAKSSKTGLLSDIRQIKEEKEQGMANVEALLGARGSKSGAMAEIRQIKEEKEKGIQKLEQALGNRPPSTSE
ncbi:glycogen [starch] synthase, liver-like isoform X2 [Bolinopsis microptera]|uniref:glycogen [starch] synthase, liver-like isoform X2 n=1 Tax=Bolinopsis microptera TaxID=2820187 RepID=UPI00307B073F